MILTWLLPILGGFVFVAVIGSYNRREVLREWEFALSRNLEAKIAELEEHVALDHLRIERAHRKALAAHQRLELPEAVRLLALATTVVREAVPDRVTRLRGMAVCCRMAAAMLPMPPLLPSDFRLESVRSLAAAARLVHYLLVSMQERFRARVWFLSLGYHFVSMAADRMLRQAGARPARVWPWTKFTLAFHDFRRLDQEHVLAFRTLLESLSAEAR